MAFNVGDTVLYKMDGENKNLRGKEGTITKIVDGKKTVKFKGVAKEVLVKAVNMVVVDLKKEVGAGAPGPVAAAVAADGMFKKGEKIIYFFEAGAGRFGDVKYNGFKGEITADQFEPDYVEAKIPEINPGAIEWYAYNIRRDVVAPGARVAPAPLPEAAPVLEVAAAAPAPAIAAPVVENLYAQAQALWPWQVGDVLKVLRTAEYGEGGWNVAWNQAAMNRMVGEQYAIEDIDNKNGFKLGGYWFPYFVLQFVREAEKLEVFNYKGVKFTISADRVLVGQYRFENADELVEKLALAHAKVKGIAA